MHDPDLMPYVIASAIRADIADETGEYLEWDEIECEFPAWLIHWLEREASYYGVDANTFLLAIVMRHIYVELPQLRSAMPRVSD